MSKKWPVLAQLIIAIGVLNGIGYLAIATLYGLEKGFKGYTYYFLTFLLGIAGIIIYWNFYKLKKWAITGLNIYLSISIVLFMLSFFSKAPDVLMSSFGIVFLVSVLIYFNSKKIRNLFA
jgi:predicted membrane channel-forming protein YqfA (hemolysin III family)